MIPKHIATYIGVQDGMGDIPPVRLYNLEVPLHSYPRRTTLTEETIKALLIKMNESSSLTCPNYKTLKS